MKYILQWVESKSPEWKVATITNEAGLSYSDVSINKTNKKGEVFPNFDTMMVGHTIEGEYWETPDKSKKYLFPPRPINTSPRGSGSFTGASKMMEKKQEGIKESLDIKARNIAQAQDRSAWMWAKTNASELLKGLYSDQISNDEIANQVLDLATKIYNGEPLEPFK